MCHFVISKLLNPIKITFIKNLGGVCQNLWCDIERGDPQVSHATFLSSFIKTAQHPQRCIMSTSFLDNREERLPGTFLHVIPWKKSNQPKNSGLCAQALSQVHSVMGEVVMCTVWSHTSPRCMPGPPAGRLRAILWSGSRDPGREETGSGVRDKGQCPCSATKQQCHPFPPMRAFRGAVSPGVMYQTGLFRLQLMEIPNPN